MSDNVERVKCACTDCVCETPINEAIEQGGRYYCGDACAKNHTSGRGCDHTGCQCQGSKS